MKNGDLSIVFFQSGRAKDLSAPLCVQCHVRCIKFAKTSFYRSSNRNEYQELFLWGNGGRCIGLTTLPLSSADWLEVLGASTACAALRAYRRLFRDSFTFT